MSLDLTRYTIQGVEWLGSLGQTTSHPGLLRGADGLEYVCKARWLNPNEPYTPANELLAGFLCDNLQLPIPRFRVIDFLGERYFGSQHHHKHFFITPDEPDLPYGQILANLLVFDVWVCNTDRHLRNIIMIEGLPAQLMIIDHAKALLGEGKDTLIWEEKLRRNDLTQFILAGNALTYQGFLRKYIRTFDVFEEMLTRIAQFPEQDLRSYVYGNIYLTQAEKESLFVGLKNRRGQQLRDLLHANRGLFGLP